MVNNFLNASIIMKKISKIIIGTHNRGKFKEISDLLRLKELIMVVR